jgi:uncharacterized membrane protein YkoI
MRTLLAGLAVLSVATFAMAAEKAVKLQDLPPAVQKAMQEQTKGAEVKGYAQETEKGKVFYEVETKVAGRGRDLSFDPTGKLVVVEEEVPLDEVPAAAKAAIAKAAGSGKVGMVEKVTEGDSITYEAHVTKAGKKSEVLVKPDGSPAK